MSDQKQERRFVVKDDKLSGPGSTVFRFSDNPPEAPPSLEAAYQKFAAKVEECFSHKVAGSSTQDTL